MKKIIPLAFLAAVIMTTACNKIDNNVNLNPKPSNYATVGNFFSKENGKPIVITFTVGHNASECGNSCITENGVPGHADCQGFGDDCVVTIRIWPIGGQPKGATFSAVVDTVWSLTTEDFFNMPDRSLNYTDENNNRMYLNIPEQLVFRDSVTRQFTFTGLFFTDDPEYMNE